MNNVMFDLGFLQIKWYSFFIFFATIIGSILIYKESKKKGLKGEDLENILFYGFLVGILGARIYYILFNLDFYLKSPIEMLKMWNGGLAIHGGIIGTLTFVVLYTKKKKINLYLLLDTLVVGLIIGQAIGRWGNFFNGEAYGRIVTLDFLQKLHLPEWIINGMYIDGFYREPTFLYESIFSFFGFLILLGIRRIPKLRVSQLTGVYLIWYGIERLIIESFRSDSLMLGTIKIAQVISLLFIIVGIYFILKNIKNNRLYKEERMLLEN